VSNVVESELVGGSGGVGAVDERNGGSAVGADLERPGDFRFTVPRDDVEGRGGGCVGVGLCAAGLAGLPGDTVIDERKLAALLQMSPRTVRRVVGRGQLPPGVKLGGRSVWVVRKVIEFLVAEAERVDAAARRLRLRRSELGE